MWRGSEMRSSSGPSTRRACAWPSPSPRLVQGAILRLPRTRQLNPPPAASLQLQLALDDVARLVVWSQVAGIPHIILWDRQGVCATADSQLPELDSSPLTRPSPKASRGRSRSVCCSWCDPSRRRWPTPRPAQTSQPPLSWPRIRPPVGAGWEMHGGGGGSRVVSLGHMAFTTHSRVLNR